MPSPISVKVYCQEHLVQFLTAIYGQQPITFPRKDHFNLLLNACLKRSTSAEPIVSEITPNLEILLPFFDDLNVLYNFDLSPRSEALFVKHVDRKFKITFHSEIDKYVLIGILRIDAIYLFMEQFDLEEECLDLLIKDYQRYRDTKKQRGRYIPKNKSSVKRPNCPEPHIV